MSAKTTELGLKASSLVLVSRARGLTVIPESTPLTRLNYFDGKFLRASDLTAEQAYLRKLVQLSNQAGGSGVAHGFGVRLGTGDTLRVGAGLAVTPEGQVLLMPLEAVLPIERLIEASRRQTGLSVSGAARGSSGFGDCVEAAAAPENVLRAENLYLVTVAPAEALCGEEDVFGKLCEEACTTGTDRPYRVEGVIFRATPLVLSTPLPVSAAVALGTRHLRSRVASSYFEDERKRVASLISGDGLQSELWCMGAEGIQGTEVPIAVFSRSGSTTRFLDAWIARRELIDSPAKRYWQWRMAMRPWDVFLAQVLQFQCQLRDVFSGSQPGDEDDPCVRNTRLVAAAASQLAEVREFYAAATRRLATVVRASGEQPLAIAGGLAALEDLQKKLTAAGSAALLPGNRVLIDSGIVTLPSAGYLPVVPGANATVNTQVKRLMGQGVNLRFCVVRPDYVAHALEEAQHMERISLLEGLDSGQKKPAVDILVPDGIIVGERPPAGSAFRAHMRFGAPEQRLSTTAAAITPRTEFTGAGRVEASESGPVRMHVAVEGVKLPADATGASATGASAWISGTCRDNPFAPGAGSVSSVELRFVLVPRGKVPGLDFVDMLVNGSFYHGPASTIGPTRIVKGKLSGSYSSQIGTGDRRGGAFTMEAEARLTAGGTDPLAQPPRLRLTLRDSVDTDVALTLDFAWKGAPLQISVKAAAPDLGDLDLVQSADVLDPHDQANVLAHNAVEAIMKRLAEPNFKDQALSNLFPAPPAPVEEAIVQATLDWVLFHRRRSKRCGEEAPKPAPAPSRSYQAYHLLFSPASDISLTRIIEALRRNETDFLRRIPFRPVSLAEFAALSADLITQPSTILADWNGLDPKPGPDIVYGAVGSKEDAEKEGKPLAEARLESLMKAVEPSSKPAGSAVTDVLESPPDALPSGPDGVMVLITTARATVCNSIFRAPNLDTFKQAAVLIREGQIGQAMQSLAPVHTVQFDQASGAPVASSFTDLPSKYQQAGGGGVAAALVVFREGDTTTPEDRLKNQGSEIARRIDSASTPDIDVVPSRVALPVNCPALTVLAPHPIILFSGFSFNASADPNTIGPSRRQVVGDAVLRGSGGTAGQEVKVNVQITLNVPVDNPATQPPRLVIDDPAEEREGVNMFPGVPVAGNTSARLFADVPLKFPGGGERVFRIKNVSCNATSLRNAAGAPAPVTLEIAITGATVQVSPPRVTVAAVRQG